MRRGSVEFTPSLKEPQRPVICCQAFSSPCCTVHGVCSRSSCRRPTVVFYEAALLTRDGGGNGSSVLALDGAMKASRWKRSMSDRGSHNPFFKAVLMWLF